MPAGMTHEEHQAQMKKDAEMKSHGAQAMGFDQDAVLHHFLLASDGGAIQVDVRVPADETTRQTVQRHLRAVAAAFATGDFHSPLVTHAEMPDGVGTLQRLKSMVTYLYTATPNGGRVRIVTTNGEALAAIHDFLRYQIREHKTGDPMDMMR